LRGAEEARCEAELAPLAEGTYRLRVDGDGDVNPVTDIFAVFDEGTDLGG
jgi:hypothetical protein